MNEEECGGAKKSVFGRKIDLLPMYNVKDLMKNEVSVELGAIEVKSEATAENLEIMQLNKNIKVNKNIMLYTLKLYTNVDASSESCVIGADIIGLHGFLYTSVQHDGVVFAIKLSNEDMFLPKDEDDMIEFLSSDTIDQLLYYVDHLKRTRDELKQGFKHQKRKTHNVKTTMVGARVTFSPPAAMTSFPQATFYTPKRDYTKKKN